MPVGEMGKVEHVAPPVPALDDHAGACGVDRDHLGRLPVQALGPVVVAGELLPIAGPELLRDLDERLGLGGAPAGGLPVVRLAALGDEPDGATLHIDGLHPVADPGTRAAFLRLAERDDVAGLVAGRALGLGAGESARFEYGRNHGVLAERAIADERGADGVGQLLPPLAGRVEHQRPGAVFAGQRGEVAGEDGLAGLGVGLLDDAPAPGVERLERGLGVAVQHGLHGRLGVQVGLADDFLQPERRHAVVLELAESAAGKSALMDAVLDLVPEEERVAYSAMTGQSLFYLGEADLKHKALAIAEEEGARHAAYALKLLQSQGALTIASTGKDPATGKLVTQDYKVEGPVALMLTTTAIDLDEELRNRCLVLTIDEGREQTRAIHVRQRYEETLAGLVAREDGAAIRTLHHNAQRLLQPMKVVNPYAEHLTFLDDKTRTRRDHRKYLGLIRAIALLHQHQRPTRTLDRPGMAPLAYIEVTLDDIAAANRLAHAVLGTTLDELPPQTRTLLGLVRTHIDARAAAEGVQPRDVRFTRREVREATGWGDTQLKLHLGRLESLEYLLVRRDGTRFVNELAWAGEGEAGTPFVMGLLDVERLRQRYDGERSGLQGQRSASGRGDVGEVSPPGRSSETARTAGVVRLAAPSAGQRPENTSLVGVGERRSCIYAAR